jgi:hypothetical protein
MAWHIQMVDDPAQKNDYTENVEQSLKDFSESSSDKSNYEGTYLFFSFDLVNSTAFKNKENNWSEIFDQFFAKCKEEMSKLFQFAVTWKLIGDEILFYLRVNSEDELYNSPKNTFTVLTNCISFLNELPNTKPFLSIKATIWAANASDSKETSVNKIIIERDIDNEILDFLGTDIDIGFRISKYALNSVLVVEAKLACLLTKLKTEMRNEHISNYMRIVSYEQLKGVWDNRYYPIVWYKDNWTYSNNMFVYDDKYNSDIVQRIESSKGESLEDVSKLTKIFSDLNKLDRVESLQKNIIARKNPIQKKIPREKLSELHIVAICVNSKEEILVAKRTEKDTLPNTWEFGCSQLRINQDFISAINESYHKDFGITLDYIQDDPLPIGAYQFKKAKENNRIVPGIIFVCRIESGEDDIKLDESKHSEYRFINKETYRDIMKESTIDDFEKRMLDTYSLLEKPDRPPNATGDPQQ